MATFGIEHPGRRRALRICASLPPGHRIWVTVLRPIPISWRSPDSVRIDRRIGMVVACALAFSALGVVVPVYAQAARSVRLLGYPCASEESCHLAAMYKPRTFQLGSHYWFTNVKWLSWNSFTASATVTLHAEFPGARPTTDRTVVVFSNDNTLCRVKTYTRWVSGDGNAQDAENVRRLGCGWYLGNP